MELNRIEEPYVFELNDSNNLKLIMDSSASLEGKNRGMTPMQLLLGALMGKEGVPTPYDRIHFRIYIDKDIDLKRVNRAVDLSLNKYCSVRASLHPDIAISYEVFGV